MVVRRGREAGDIGPVRAGSQVVRDVVAVIEPQTVVNPPMVIDAAVATARVLVVPLHRTQREAEQPGRRERPQKSRR